MKIALVQLNYVVGDLEGNAIKIAQAVHRAQQQEVDLVITSELAITGYPPRDLLLRSAFIQQAGVVLRNLAEEVRDAPPVLVGTVELNPALEGRPLFNTAALLVDGEIALRFHKSLLPTYDVFDEDRYFESASVPQIYELADRKIGITVCEDVWNDRGFWSHQRYHLDPVEQLVKMGANFIINISASPFTVGKQQLRESMLGAMARRHHIPLVYCNQVGGNDDLIFDGRSCAFDAKGKLIARASSFQEDTVIIDMDKLSGSITDTDFAPESEAYQALVSGTRDYVQKCGFKRVLLGLSGGIDSALTAVIAAKAVGPENVLGVMMPSPYSSVGSVEDSKQLVQNLGIQSLILPISSIMEAYDEILHAAFVNYDKDITEENIQARARGNLLMSLSNKYRALLLTTGNKSELAVGYCTLYGDMSGGLAVIADLPKTMVYAISRWINATSGNKVIPEPILTKAPSAELRPGQTDQDSLPPYDILDRILSLHIESHQSASEIIAQGFDENTVRQVLQLVKIAEFKRKQAAPGIKVTDRAFGTGWRMPIASRATI